MVSQPVIIVTADGSQTLYLQGLNEHYHSINGALAETVHVFLQNGFLSLKERPGINLLEIGFGTGLNALATAIEAVKQKIKVNYYTYEKYPVSDQIISQLDYGLLFNGENARLFQAIHQAEWNRLIEIDSLFSIQKSETDFTDCNLPPNLLFDVVYFDAFAPDIQPELWTLEIFQKIFKNMAEDAVLTTYSAKGEVRRRLQAAGFFVERLPGPAGKREMLRAIRK